MHVDRNGYSLNDVEGLFESFVVGRYNNDRMNIAFQLRKRLGKDFTS